MKFTLTEIAKALGARYDGPPVPVEGWSIDSRTIASGDCFFALRGPNHDGHDHVGAAFENGAAAAVVDHVPAGCEGLPLIPVTDTQLALESLGAWARVRWNREVVAVTGSAGKTTTKDVIAAMLAVRKRVGKTTGNLNNHIGVPLSILRLPDESEIAVLEMGMNHGGEIAALSRIARPNIGVVTNVGHAHVENFESIEGVAAAKRELVEALPPDGVAVLNADDPLVRGFSKAHPGRSITFGLESDADVRGEDVRYSETGVQFRIGDTMIESQLSGRHSVLNLLAGVAIAGIYGIPAAELASVIASIEPGSMRGKRFESNGIQHINDCYNSNPDAARVMIDLLVETPATRRIAVMGEMLELGRWSEPLHRDLGIYIARSGTHVLVGIRGAAMHAVKAAIEAGLPESAAFFFESPLEAGEFVKRIARSGDAILWKGSRGTRVETALERFFG